MGFSQSDVYKLQKQDERTAADHRLARTIIRFICNQEHMVPLTVIESRLSRCAACPGFRGDGCPDYPKGFCAALVGAEGPPCEKWAGI